MTPPVWHCACDRLAQIHPCPTLVWFIFFSLFLSWCLLSFMMDVCLSFASSLQLQELSWKRKGFTRKGLLSRSVTACLLIKTIRSWRKNIQLIVVLARESRHIMWTWRRKQRHISPSERNHMGMWSELLDNLAAFGKWTYHSTRISTAIMIASCLPVCEVKPQNSLAWHSAAQQQALLGWPWPIYWPDLICFKAALVQQVQLCVLLVSLTLPNGQAGVYPYTYELYCYWNWWDGLASVLGTTSCMSTNEHQPLLQTPQQHLYLCCPQNYLIWP